MQPKESKSNSHFWISLVKSVLRLTACWFLFNQMFVDTAILLGLAEILGIVEEL